MVVLLDPLEKSEVMVILDPLVPQEKLELPV